MGNINVVVEVLLKFTEPYIAIGETNHDEIAYQNLVNLCYLHDYCYDLIRENAELKNTYGQASIFRAKERAINHIKESVQIMTDLLNELEADKGEE